MLYRKNQKIYCTTCGKHLATTIKDVYEGYSIGADQIKAYYEDSKTECINCKTPWLDKHGYLLRERR